MEHLLIVSQVISSFVCSILMHGGEGMPDESSGEDTSSMPSFGCILLAWTLQKQNANTLGTLRVTVTPFMFSVATGNGDSVLKIGA